MTKHILLALTVITLSSCTSNTDKEKFINTYAQILLVREQNPDSANGNAKVQAVITSNGYTQESFKSEFIKYSRDAQSFRILMDTVQQRAKRLPH